MRWSGHVLSVGRKYFWARLKVNGDDVEEEAKIPIALVQDRDRDLLREGGILDMWASKKVTVRFRRYKPWTQEELAAAERRAKKLMARVNVE